MSTEFFAKLEQKSAEHDAQVAAHANDRNHRREITRKVIRQAVPILNEYKNKLEEIGIKVKLVVAGQEDDYLVFELYYADNDYYGFELHRGELLHRGKDGKHAYTTSPSAHCMDEVVDTESLKKTIEKTIDDFMFYEKKHGGFKRNVGLRIDSGALRGLRFPFERQGVLVGELDFKCNEREELYHSIPRQSFSALIDAVNSAIAPQG